MVVWKYPLRLELLQTMNAHPAVPMPSGAKVLTIQMQGGVPTIWALVDPEKPLASKCFVFHGTGTPIDDIRGEYIGTVQLYAGSLVLHCFEDPL